MALEPDVIAGDPIEPVWGNAIRDATVQVCLAASKPLSPHEGQVIAVTDKDRLEVWDGTTWNPGPAWGPAGRIGFSAWCSAPASIIDSTTIGGGGSAVGPTWLSYDTERWDSSGILTVPSGLVTIPAGLGGIWWLTAHAAWAASAPGTESRALITVNGSVRGRARFANQAYSAATISQPFVLAAGDVVKHLVYQNSGGTILTNVYGPTADDAEMPTFTGYRLSG